MENNIKLANQHIEKITKKFIIDYMNGLLFSNTVLWDGDDQFNELPIFYTSNEDGFRVEQRGALFVSKQTAKAMRLSVVATQSTVQRVCYRFTGLSAPMRIDESPRLYYPFDGPAIDISIASLHLGLADISSYSFSDNTDASGNISLQKMFALLRHIISSTFIFMEDKEIFGDLINHTLSLPPIPSDAHYVPVYGAADVADCRWD